MPLAAAATKGRLNTVGAAILALLAAAFSCAPASAAAPAVSSAAAVAARPDKMLIDADQLVYDKGNNDVLAIGDVQLYYKKRILQADKVIYHRTDRRVYAEGHVKLTDETGDVVFATRLELTDDFKDGFIDRAQALATNGSRLSASRVERSGGLVSVAQNGVYTACEPCKDHPERPPFWQVRASKVTEDQGTHTIHYENAWLEIAGTPIAYIPYFSTPDATVSRHSGLLAPRIFQGSRIGFGLGLPIFLDLAPNYDLTLTPTYLSKQGFYGEAEWRQRFASGAYDIRLTGIEEQKPGLFQPTPYGSGAKRLRGSLETKGLFYLNEKWKFGWDQTWLSDRFYLQDFKIKGADTSANYYQDIVSSIFLRGQGQRGFFDLSAYRFQGVTASDEQRALPLVAVLDYDKGFSLPPGATGGLGGELTLTLNAQHVHRSEAAFQSTGAQALDQAFSLYNVCETGGVPTYNRSACLLRGVAGEYTRATSQLAWERKFIDPLGQEWKPFAFARADGEMADIDLSGGFNYASQAGTSTVLNASQTNFFGGAGGGSAARTMVGAGLEYRFPFVSRTGFATQIIQPIAQLIVRPGERLPRVQPNEDAQSLVFDETNLFAIDKYSGFDRMEGGVRLNYGVQYDASFANGGNAHAVVGQSIQLAGRNSYAIADAANAGLGSGLDKKYSNFVAGETLAPFAGPLTFGMKQQFDAANFGVTRFDALVSAKLDRFWATFDYGRYAAEPLLGWPHAREGFSVTGGLKLTDTWSLDGGLFVDMSRHFYDTAGQSTPKWFAANYSMGIAYANSCTTFKVRYSNAYTNPATSVTNGVSTTAPGTRDQSLFVELDLRTLGGVHGGLNFQ